MDILLPSPTTAITIYLLLFLLFLYSLLWLSRRVHTNPNNKRSPPQPDGSWPFIGHLLLLGGPEPPHITLGKLADKYGPIFGIKMGTHRSLVISNWEIAKECFTINDKAFSNRPKYLAGEILGYNYAMFGFSPYGPYWRHIRKIATLEVLSNHRLELLKHVRESEVKMSLKEIYDLWVQNKGVSDKVMVEMRSWFSGLTLNVVTQMVVGKSFRGANTKEEMEEKERCGKAIRSFLELAGAFAPSDAVPFLRWLDIGGFEKTMKNIAAELDEILQGFLAEHKEKRHSGEIKGENDFMDMMVSILAEAGEPPSYDADTINKATCLAIIIGGTDTTAVSLTWALSLLLNNRHILRKVQDELDTHVGRERRVNDSDIKNLVYFQAIVKETLRLYPAAPLSVPHESTEDCIISGYHVPAGTRLLVNLSKLHHDPKIWTNPCKFQPERFLTKHKDLDVRGQNYEFIPFGTGRRVCPGISFALQTFHLTLASLLHGFEFATPNDEAVDMTESMGITSIKATPLDVLLAPRLSGHLYG